MSEELIKQWLFASESDSLEFKREQYRFTKASVDDKSEMLKDILAMANSWRQVDGYIVVGIEHRVEKPNIINGIDVTDPIEDAQLQQFVNSKVVGICEFSYSTFTVEGKTIGVFRLPVQKRPVYIKNDYGKRRANVVHVRRGSSSEEASPDEIIQMGIDFLKLNIKPNIEISLFDTLNSKYIEGNFEVEANYISVVDPIPDYSKGDKYPFNMLPVNRNYYREYVEHINFKLSFASFSFSLTNKGNKEATNIHIEIEILSSSIKILLDDSEIVEPEKDSLTNSFQQNPAFHESPYTAKRMENKWFITNKLSLLHAKQTLNLEGKIYLQSKKSETIKCITKVFFDGQASPTVQEFNIQIKFNQIELNWDVTYQKFLSLSAHKK